MNDITIAVAAATAEKLQTTVARLSTHQEWIQIDIADGSMTQYQTVTDMAVLKDVIASSGRSFEAHLLLDQPHKYVNPLIAAGFKRVIAHVEANDPRRFLHEAGLESIEAGIALQAATEIEQLEPFMEEADFIVIMTAEVGSTESPFLPEALEKIKTVKLNAPDAVIAVEGGLDPPNARLVVESGATRLVISSVMFEKEGVDFMGLLSRFRSI